MFGKYQLTLFSIYFLISIFSINVIASDSLTTKKHFKNPLEFRKGRINFAVFPVASIDPASGIELGIMPVFSISPKNDSIIDDYYRSSSLATHVTYSTKNWANIRSEGQFFTAKGDNITVFVQFLNAPDYFYGIGNDIINKQPSRYQNRYLKFGFETTKCFNKKHFVGLKADFQSQDIADIEGNVLNPKIEGINGGNIIGVGPIYKFDTRNNVHYPSKGFYIQTSIVHFNTIGKSSNYFTIYSLDCRKYLKFFNSYYIAIQGLLNSSSGNVPFYKLPTLGGKYNLRGISNKYMYIDKNVWYGQAEIRKMLYKRIGFVAFSGLGNTFSTWNNDMISKVKVVYGFGARIQLIPKDQINLRFDYAIGPNGDRGFYATIRESF